MKKLYSWLVILLMIFPFIKLNAQSQCPDAIANKWKEKALEADNDLDGSAEAYRQIAIYEIAVCACKSGELNPDADVNSFRTKAMEAKSNAERMKSDLTFRPWPSKCKFKSSSNTTEASNSQNNSTQNTIQSYNKAYNSLQQSQERAARAAREVKKFNSISSSGDPFEIMDEYHHNLSQIENLQSQLEAEISKSSFETGQSIGTDIGSGNYEGVFWTGLSLIGKSIENNEAKKEMERQKNALKKEQEKKMLEAALQLIEANEAARDKWLESAAMALEEDKERYFMAKAIYHNSYANHANNNFSYSNTNWAVCPVQSINKPEFKTASTSIPLHKKYSETAERKYKLYEDYKVEYLLEGAVNYMSSAINSHKRNANYYLRLAEIAEDYDMNLSMLNYLSAAELDPSLISDDRWEMIRGKYIGSMVLPIAYFSSEYDPSVFEVNTKYQKDRQEKFYFEPLDFIENMVKYDFHLIGIEEVFTKKSKYLKFISPLAYAVSHPESDGLLKIIELHTLKKPKEKQYFLDQALHVSVVLNNPVNVQILIDQGANVDAIIKNKSAVTLANDLNSFKTYPQLLDYSKDKSKYIKMHENSVLYFLSEFEKKKNSNFTPLLNNIPDDKVFRKVSENILELYWSDPLYGTYNKTIINRLINMPRFQYMLIQPEFSKYLEQRFFTLVTKNHYNSVTPEAENKKDIGASRVFVNKDLLLMNSNLRVSSFITDKEMVNDKLLNYKDSTCLLCIDIITMEYRLEKILDFYGELAGINSMSEGDEMYRVSYNKYTSILKNFREGKGLVWTTPYSSIPEEISSINLNYRIAARENGLPLINSEKGIIKRPIDYSKETYPHIALLTNNYPLFKAFNKKHDLSILKNKDDQTLIDYINILVTEDGTFIKYAAVEGLRNKFDWSQRINGRLPVDILLENQDFELLLLLVENELIDFDFNTVLHDIAMIEKPDLIGPNLETEYRIWLENYKFINELHKKGLIDINLQDRNGRTLIHQYLQAENDLFPVNDGVEKPFFKAPSETPLKYLTDVDRSIVDNEGNTAWKLINNKLESCWRFSYTIKELNTEAKEAKKLWKAALK